MPLCSVMGKLHRKCYKPRVKRIIMIIMIRITVALIITIIIINIIIAPLFLPVNCMNYGRTNRIPKGNSVLGSGWADQREERRLRDWLPRP